MEELSTKQKVAKIIDFINAQDHTQLSVDVFLNYEQLINELSQENINFAKLRKYGCPSEYISCVFACKGVKPNASPQLCQKCWKDALTTTVIVDDGMSEAPQPSTPEETTQIEEYAEILDVSVSGANYFAAAAQSLKEQFTQQHENHKKKHFFSKKEKKKPINVPKVSFGTSTATYSNGTFDKKSNQVSNTPTFSKLAVLGLTEDEILKVFDLLEWQTIRDYELLCSILKGE